MEWEGLQEMTEYSVLGGPGMEGPEVGKLERSNY